MVTVKIGQRASMVPPSPIRKLVPLADAAKKRGIHVYHLNIGQPDIETPPEFWRAIRGYAANVLAYGNSQGMADYLVRLAAYYQRLGLAVTSDDIIGTTGGSEAIVFAMTIVCDPGDEVIVFEPFYTNYNGFAVQAGVRLVPVETVAEKGFHLPPAEVVEQAITARTKAILYCNPNNPTGTVYTDEELEMLKTIAMRHGLFLLADEVYREFVYEGRHRSVLSLAGVEDRAVMLDSISKRFSACGARVGNLVTKNRDVHRAALHLGQARLCPPTLEQIGAAAAYALGDDYFASVREEYRRRRDVVFEGLSNIEGTVCHKPNGAFYVMAKLPIDDAEKFAEFMLSEFSHDGKTVMVAPGPGFYASPGKGQSECRIAYVLGTEHLREAMHLLRIGVQEYNSR